MKRRTLASHTYARMPAMLLALISVWMIAALQNTPTPAPVASMHSASVSCQAARDNSLSESIQMLPQKTHPSAQQMDWDSRSPDQEVGNSTIINILLIGQDRREGEKRSRSDTMILCTFRPKENKLILTSFLRDLYVEIPGYSGNRINAAYVWGGMPLLEQTLEDNFGVTIDGSMEVDFSQFAGLIDLLGGVTLELRQDEACIINQETGSSLTEGSQHLTGCQALVYSRIRNLDADGDFSRTGRQRKVLSALLERYRASRLSTILRMVDDILPMITTDMQSGQLLRYAMEIFPTLSELEVTSQHIPAAGTFREKTINGMAVLEADMEKARQLLLDTAVRE